MQKNQKKITFKVVQMKFSAMHITCQKIRFEIFVGENVQNIFMEHDLYSLLNVLKICGIKDESIILSHTMYFWLLLVIFPSGLRLVLWSGVTYDKPSF